MWASLLEIIIYGSTKCIGVSHEKFTTHKCFGMQYDLQLRHFENLKDLKLQNSSNLPKVE